MSGIGIVLIALFLVLVMFKVPVAISLLVPSLMYLILFGFSPGVIADRLVGTLFQFSVLAVPLFIYVGALMNESGIADKIFTFTQSLIGHFRGGLAYTNVLASLLFSGMSGSAIADIGGIGKVLIGTMDDHGYDSEYSAGLTAASATVGPIFPPSIPLIIYGLLAQVSVLSLLLAGALPALLLTVMLLIITAIQAQRGKFPEPDERADTRKVVRTFVIALPALLAPVILIGGMLFGYFSPTEVAAVTAVYMLGINIVFYGDISIRVAWDAAVESARLTSDVLFIVGAAGLFTWVLTREGIIGAMGEFLMSFSTSTLMLLLMVNILLLVLGMFIDPLAALVLAIPMVVPPLVEAGLDPIHIGVIMVFNLMIGMLTPPLGISLFVASGISNQPVSKIIRELAPFYVGLLIALLIVTFVPWFSLWLPGLA